MHIRNIDRVLVYREVRDHVFTLEEIARDYPIVPAGTLIYYGFGEKNVQHYRKTGSALNGDHRTVVENLLRTLRASPDDEKTFQLVVGPTEKEPFAYVAAHMGVMRQLAVELAEYQAQALAMGKRLNVVVRYASEMNSGTWVYAGDPHSFKPSFIAVRRVFAEHAARIVFPFSPGIRADTLVEDIAPYWPGEEHVDVIGATWYVHGEAQRARGMANMREYFLKPLARGKPFAVDEFGGAEGYGSGEPGSKYEKNDVMLEAMLHELEELRLHGVSFAYGTIFLDDGKYGVDATLRFLRPSS